MSGHQDTWPPPIQADLETVTAAYKRILSRPALDKEFRELIKNAATCHACALWWASEKTLGEKANLN